MRIWDIPVNQLCNKHLVAEHHEAHCIYSVITNGLKGFSHHPETERWRNKLGSLHLRHDQQALEIYRRGMRHHSGLPYIFHFSGWPKPWQSVEEQVRLLRERCQQCRRNLESGGYLKPSPELLKEKGERL